MKYAMPLMMLLGLFCIGTLQAHRVYYAYPNGAVVVDHYHNHWWHENVYVGDPWYHPDHVYFYNGAPYPTYYNGYPYYYYDPRFYYFVAP